MPQREYKQKNHQHYLQVSMTDMMYVIYLFEIRK